MSSGDDEHAGASAKPRGDAAAGAPDENSDSQLKAALAAGSALVAASRHLLRALRTLAVAEARVLRAGIPLFFMGAVALVALSVSLWVCLVALCGWLLMLATGSLGIALALLVVGHVILVAGVWFALKYSLRQATFPQARAELGLLRHSLRRDINRFTDATTATNDTNDTESSHAPHEKENA